LFVVKHKAIYDLYGEYVLKQGGRMPDGSKYLNLFKFLAIIGGGYFMSKNADKMWEELFGSSNIKAE